MKHIYLDNAATTKPSQKVIEAMSLAMKNAWGNPSSIHSTGQEAKKILDSGRRAVAEFLGCGVDEIIFTSGGSESDNLAIRGIVEQVSKSASQQVSKPHVITSAVEHHAVLYTVQELEKEGKIEATYLKPDKNGVVSPEMVEAAIRENTILVSIIYVNNETGVINPITEISSKLKAESKKRETSNSELQTPVYFHTDAVQAAEFCEMNVEKLGVDLLTLTAHKFHGPRGIGVLYRRKGVPIKAEITGGSQEFNLRAGTENAAAIAGLLAALGEVRSKKQEVRGRIASLRDRLIKGTLDKIPDAILNGAGALRASHIVNISFLNAEGEAIILNLDFLGIQVSSGSACTSRSLDPSHVLSAMGVPPEKAHGSIRFSLSRDTTEEEIDKVLEVLPGIILKLRQMSPFK